MASHIDTRRAGRSPLTVLAALSYLMMVPSVLAMNFVSREEWKARAPEEAYKPMTDAKGVKVHYLGPEFSGKQHSECDGFMRSVQNEHMDESPEDYFDIAYNLAVCEHGYVFDGRGKGHRSGANGNVQLNSDHYAVLAFLGKSGVTEPSDAQITGLQDSIAYLRRAGAGDEIKGHRDGYNTECPGGPLYKLVTDGSLDPGKLWDGGSHIVQKGEDLDTISTKYNVPKQYIIATNNLQSPYRLVVNQTIEVPARGVPLTESGN
ncbi:N-acetylmuramoyl-L-alanine amidase domain-containing protein [Aspergillus pseudocaelatus]|uniref:N-acetylmuramoyl-L-alanine amidase domain-containing protein n=1 Tax=Aspergillus pseudocaelatus TaxID=1825620 RepID=A0ABQ6WT20_9EURO|nr:N-acetylmuramoyl-L-alanine amidase domain-containing protein [Aspergillus pseudocaelatus]